MEAVGLTATFTTRGIPLVIPPTAPPAWLVRVATRPPSITRGSLCWLPRIPAAAKPVPKDTPRTAGMPNRAPARRFSTPANMGSPTPAGRPTAKQRITPPTLSQSIRAASIAWRILIPASSLNTGKGFCSSAARSGWLTRAKSGTVSEMSAIRSMWAAMVTFCRSSNWRARPPAKHSGAVSRPENWPPPRMS